MNRSEVREQAFKLMYSLEIQKNENLEEQVELYLESNEILDQNAIEYIKDAVFGIEENKEEIIKKIESPKISINEMDQLADIVEKLQILEQPEIDVPKQISDIKASL